MAKRRMLFREFCDVVREAIESLPEPLQTYLENVAVDVEDEPGPEHFAELHDRGEDDGGELLGLFIGRSLTDQGYREFHPNVIKIFRRPLERVSRTRNALIRNIRATVVHEFAHHFGFSEEDLEEFERGQSEWLD